MGSQGSKKEVKGNIKKNYFCGEQIKGSVSYSVQDSEIKVYVKLICVAERYVKKKMLYQEEVFENTIMLSYPNEIGDFQKYFSILSPQLQSMELNTWNQDEQIYIKYFIRSYLNFQDHNVKDKQRKQCEERIFIKRTYQNKIENIIKQLSYVTRQWFLGDAQQIEFWYDFENKILDQMKRYHFGWESTIGALQLILKAQRLNWFQRSQSAKIIGKYYREGFYHVQKKEQKCHLESKNNCPTAIFSRKIMMCYHVEIEFNFEYLGCRRKQYVERVLIDVVNCDNQ